MEKLLKLLNQFEKARIDAVNAKGLPYNIKLSFRPYTEETLTNKAYKGCQLEICSKYYRFIEWLVKENKINHHKISDIMIYSQWRYTGINKTTAQRVDENYLDLILMILSIQDNPIEFLVSILK